MDVNYILNARRSYLWDFQMEFSHEQMIITAERYGIWKKNMQGSDPRVITV